MIQSAPVLMGDAAQHQAALRRKSLLQHLNPQLQSLMKESDFKEAQPYLFGEDFAEKAKCKLEAAAALRKSVYPSSTKGKSGFRGSHPRKNWGRQGDRVNTYAPGKSKRDQGTSSKSEKTSKWLGTIDHLSTVHVLNAINCVNPMPKSTQAGTQRHHLEVLIGQMDLSINSTKLAGRLAQYLNNWEQITQD